MHKMLHFQKMACSEVIADLLQCIHIVAEIVAFHLIFLLRQCP